MENQKSNTANTLYIVPIKKKNVDTSSNSSTENNFLFNGKGVEYLLEHFIAKETMHEKFKGTHVDNLTNLVSWAKTNNISSKDIFMGIEERDIRKIESAKYNVFKSIFYPTRNNNYVTNETSLKIFENIKRTKNLEDSDFEQIAKEAMSNNLTNKIFLSAVDHNLEFAAKNVSLLGYYLNKNKQYDVDISDMDLKKKIITMTTRPAPGIPTPPYIKYWSIGYYKYIANKCGGVYESFITHRDDSTSEFKTDVIYKHSSIEKKITDKIKNRIANFCLNSRIKRHRLHSRIVGLEQERNLAKINADTQVTYAKFEAHRSRHPAFANHEMRVAFLTLLVAKQLNITSASMKNISIGGLLHDSGKLAIDDAILHYKGNLREDDDAFAIMQKHAELGRYNLSRFFPQEVARFATEHQENANGSGYPFGLTWNKTSLEGLIFRIIDGFDALNDTRIYKKGFSIDKISEIFEKDINKGILHKGLTEFVLKNTFPYLKEIGYDATLFDPVSFGNFKKVIVPEPMVGVICYMKDENDMFKPKEYSPALRSMVLKHNLSVPIWTKEESNHNIGKNLKKTYLKLERDESKERLKRVTPQELRKYYPNDEIHVI